jgi:hypothetical protein
MDPNADLSPNSPAPPTEPIPDLVDAGRRHFTDQKFFRDLNGTQHYNRLFLRCSAKDLTFKKVNFKWTIFDGCYFRNCVFDSCNFEGCRFVNSNFRGSTFEGCTFNYANFEKTHVDPDLLNTGCPSVENLKLAFVRSLRMNFQALGDAAAVNRAIALELEATEIHLKKSWSSTESYYRKKYKGLKRWLAWWQWLSFKVMSWVWGNGESPWKLLLTTIAFMVVMVFIHLFKASVTTFGGLWDTLGYVPQIFLGVESSPYGYGGGYLVIILVTRLILFGFFMSILIKRANRR